jgi:N-acyl-L-homoserine lactone synthetase
VRLQPEGDAVDRAPTEPAGLPEATRLSLNERAAALARKVEMFAVTSVVDRGDIYRLRYRCYLREQAIEAASDQMLHDVFDRHARTVTFGFRIAGAIVGSMRLHVLDRIQAESPTIRAFGEILLPLLQADHRIIDCSRFVVDQDASRRWPELAYVALRLPIAAAEASGAGRILAAVRKEHMPFYQRVLRFDTLCAPRPYHQLIKPLGLMVGDLPSGKHSVFERYSFRSPRRKT